MTPRTQAITIRVNEEEHRMARELAEADDEPTGRMFRRVLRERYAARFGAAEAKRKEKRR